jgi:DNA-binding helix-hairpin-helix protein with protein kinase domain
MGSSKASLVGSAHVLLRAKGLSFMAIVACTHYIPSMLQRLKNITCRRPAPVTHAYNPI